MFKNMKMRVTTTENFGGEKMKKKYEYYVDRFQKNDIEKIGERLNELGEMGWELVLFHGFAGEIWPVLKRDKKE
jgi:hypothetical protein